MPTAALGGREPSAGTGSPSGSVDGTTPVSPTGRPRCSSAAWPGPLVAGRWQDARVSALVRLERTAGIATITLDSPANRNALSARLRSELRDALDEVTADDQSRVVVLTHSGPVFCAGMDLKETAVAAAGAEGVRELPGILQRVARCPKPVIARVAGAARAGGIGILAAADVVLAAPRATFAFSEVRIGLVPAVISVPVLDRMSPVEARELLLTGEVFDADRAHRA